MHHYNLRKKIKSELSARSDSPSPSPAPPRRKRIIEEPSSSSENLDEYSIGSFVVDDVADDLADLPEFEVDEEALYKHMEKTWRAELDEEQLRTLEPKVENLRKEIENDEPTLSKIMTTEMPFEDRKLLFQQWEIYQSLTKYSEQRFLMRCKLIKALKEQTSDLHTLAVVQTEEKRLMASEGITKESVKTRILKSTASDSIKLQLLDLYHSIEEDYYCTTNAASRKKLEFALSLPYGKMAGNLPDPNNREAILEYCLNVRAVLDQELYGMANVKDELIAILNNRIRNPGAMSTIALKGGAGRGKTAIVAALASAVNLPFERIALGGMKDTTFLKGSDAHWEGSAPSIILQILKRAKISNGIILFDELDKLNESREGIEVQNALLHITDYTQNDQFCDAFLSEFSHDISKLWFIFALNDERKINSILRDRLEIVDVPGYTKVDLREIIKRHLLPKAAKDAGFSKTDLSITDNGCDVLIGLLSSSIKDNGVRPIDRAVKTIVKRLNLIRTNTLPDGKEGGMNLKHKLPYPFTLPFLIDGVVVNKLSDRPVREEIPDIYS